MKKKQMRPCRIVHVLGSLGPGGAEMGVIRLAEALNGYESEHRIVVFGTDLSLQEATATTVSCQALNLKGASYMACVDLAKTLRECKADIVHVNNLSPWFDTALAASLSRVRCIETFHGVEQGRIAFPWQKRLLFRTADKLSAIVTAVAGPAADLIAELTGIERGRIRVIPNGIDTDRFLPARDSEEKAALRRKFELPEKEFLLGCVAALRPVKNHHGLVSAFAQASQDACAASLVLVGGGSLEGDLRNQVCGLEIDKKVFFLGQRSDVPELLRTFDLFVLNSETEGLSYSLLEAMASGLPVVATNIGGNVDLIHDGKEGFLAPEGDTDALAAILKNIIENPGMLPRIGENARKRVVASFSVTAMVKEYQELYREVLDRN